MKKRWILLALAALLLALCACSAGGEAPLEEDALESAGAASPGTEEQTEEPEAVEEETPGAGTGEAESSPEEAEDLQPLVALTAIPSQTEWKDDDGGLLLQERLIQASVTLEGSEEAERAINAALQSEYEARRGEAQAMLGAARQEKAGWAELGLEFSGYAMTESVQTGRLDNRVVSVVFQEVDNTGGAHGTVSSRTANFDAATGARLQLSSIAGDVEALHQTVADVVVAQIQAEPDRYFTDAVYQAGSLLEEDNWYLSDSGLIVLSNPYALAPFAAGVLEFEVPYDQLEGILLPQWMPEEYPETEGTLQASLASDAGNIQYPLRVQIVPDGEKVAVYADGLVRDVRIRQVSSTDGVTWYAGSEYAAVNRLMPGEGIFATVMLPDVMTNVLVSCTGADGAVLHYGMIQSGKDGSVSLMELQNVV